MWGISCWVLNTGRMCELDHFDIFKEKCLKLWRPPEEKDRFLALMQFVAGIKFVAEFSQVCMSFMRSTRTYSWIL